mmetsp:Transcript_31964/g.63314  ORF Transcript_31964/g.63314 Transcript_31964/m.63314 type:complete len:494 (-) Transcript_31964:81-1562(-)
MPRWAHRGLFQRGQRTPDDLADETRQQLPRTAGGRGDPRLHLRHHDLLPPPRPLVALHRSAQRHYGLDQPRKKPGGGPGAVPVRAGQGVQRGGQPHLHGRRRGHQAALPLSGGGRERHRHLFVGGPLPLFFALHHHGHVRVRHRGAQRSLRALPAVGGGVRTAVRPPPPQTGPRLGHLCRFRHLRPHGRRLGPRGHGPHDHLPHGHPPGGHGRHAVRAPAHAHPHGGALHGQRVQRGALRHPHPAAQDPLPGGGGARPGGTPRDRGGTGHEHGREVPPPGGAGGGGARPAAVVPARDLSDRGHELRGDPVRDRLAVHAVHAAAAAGVRAAGGAAGRERGEREAGAQKAESAGAVGHYREGVSEVSHGGGRGRGARRSELLVGSPAVCEHGAVYRQRDGIHSEDLPAFPHPRPATPVRGEPQQPGGGHHHAEGPHARIARGVAAPGTERAQYGGRRRPRPHLTRRGAEGGRRRGPCLEFLCVCALRAAHTDNIL